MKKLIAHPILTIRQIVLIAKAKRKPSIRLFDRLWQINVRIQYTHSPIVKLARKIFK